MNDQNQNEKVETLHFGAYLKEARLRQGLSVRDVCEETMLSRHMVESIEFGDRNNLPEDVYLKGFVKALCKVSGADAQHALELLAAHEAPIKEASSFYMPKKSKKGLLILFILLGIAAASLLFFWLDPMSRAL